MPFRVHANKDNMSMKRHCGDKKEPIVNCMKVLLKEKSQKSPYLDNDFLLVVRIRQEYFLNTF